MKNKSRLVGAIMFLIAAWLFVIANREILPQKSKTQISFEQWLESVDGRFAKAEKPEAITPPVTLTLASADPEHNVQYRFSTSDTPDSSERIFRILSVVEGANLFSDTKWLDEAPPQTLALEVTDGKTTFKTHLPWPDERADVRIRTMLKLFQVYALYSTSKQEQVASLTSELSPIPTDDSTPIASEEINAPQ